MQHTYQMKKSELGSSFIESVKSIFKSKEIKIVVEDVEANTPLTTQSEIARFLNHREEHPSVRLNDSRDFDAIVDNQNL